MNEPLGVDKETVVTELTAVGHELRHAFSQYARVITAAQRLASEGGALGLSDLELSELLHVGLPTIQAWKTGKMTTTHHRGDCA